MVRIRPPSWSTTPRPDANLALSGGAFHVQILERHPFTSQTFVPMGLSAADFQDACYLVIVAPTAPCLESISENHRLQSPPKGIGPPDALNMRAFLARGDQAVTYAAGTWHAPMVVIGRNTVNFIVWQFANGVPDEDCQEILLEPQQDADGAVVLLPSAEGRADIMRLGHLIAPGKL